MEPRPFEKNELFEGCLPIEEMARRGTETLRYGPMRLIGLGFGNEGKKWHAVIQLRAENAQKTLFNMVGFQTRLKWNTQKELFAMVPALKNARFARLGCMHRNTFIESPKLLEPTLQLKKGFLVVRNSSHLVCRPNYWCRRLYRSRSHWLVRRLEYGLFFKTWRTSITP